MPYEIPQNLKYEEKIFLNLNFMQLAYAAVFGGGAAWVFLSKDLDWSLELRVIVSSVLVMLAVSFMYLDLARHLESLLVFARSIHETKEGKDNKKKLEKFMEIADLKKDTVFLKNGDLRAVIRVMPINFAILSRKEQQAIVAAYREFLNALDFPVQIVMRTTQLDLTEYFHSLGKEVAALGNKALEERLENFKQFLKDYVEKGDVKNRVFYIIVPQHRSLSTAPIMQLGKKKAKSPEEREADEAFAFNQLEARVKLCIDKLRKCRLQAERLNRKEVLALLASYFNKDERVTTEVRMPTYIKNTLSRIQVNDKLHRIVYANAYPRVVEEGWMNSIILGKGDFDLSLYIHPTSVEYVLHRLNLELIKQESDMLAAETRGLVNPLLKVQYNDTYKTLEQLQKGEEKLFDLGMYVDVKARDEKELELATRKVLADLNSILVIPRTPQFRMQQALQTMHPIYSDKLKINRNIPSNALAACFPFTSSFLNFDPNGVMFAVNKENSVPIILDVYKFTNYNGLILGTSGGGKSYAVKLYLLRNFMKGVKTLIIDPQGEYSALIHDLRGQVIEISRESDTIVNVFDLLGGDFGDKLLSLQDLYRIMFGELSEEQKNILDRATLQIYEDKGIIPNDAATWGKEAPTLGNLYEAVERMGKKAEHDDRREYVSLLNRIRIFTHGAFSFMNRPTNLDVARSSISFNIEKMPKQVKPIMMYLILNFIVNRMKSDKDRKLLVVDEAWSLLRHGEQAEYLFELIKTSRKYALGLAIITQEVDDLLTTVAGNTILANTSWKMLLRQEPAVIKNLAEKFNLNPAEQNQLLTADIGEGLLFAMNERIPVQVIASPAEHDLITTNPDELREKRTAKT